jgi:hypothetical protein
LVVLFEQLVNHGLGLTDFAEAFSIKYFAAQRPVDVLILSILPRQTWIDEALVCA